MIEILSMLLISIILFKFLQLYVPIKHIAYEGYFSIFYIKRTPSYIKIHMCYLRYL